MQWNVKTECKQISETSRRTKFKAYLKLDLKQDFNSTVHAGLKIITMSVTLHCDVGDLKLELYCEECPKTAKNFIALAASGYYDGCKFHRNIKGFMVQSGDPTGKEFQSVI